MRIDLVNRPTQTLAATAIVLALIVALELRYPAAPEVSDAGLERAEQALPDFGDPRFEPPPLATLSEMLDRPLFFTDRRIPEAPRREAAPAPPPPPPLRLRLEGIAITGESRVAVLRDVGTHALVQLAEGMTHDGWTLESVDAGGARFSRGEEVTRLLLDAGQDAGRR